MNVYIQKGLPFLNAFLIYGALSLPIDVWIYKYILYYDFNYFAVFFWYSVFLYRLFCIRQLLFVSRLYMHVFRINKCNIALFWLQSSKQRMLKCFEFNKLQFSMTFTNLLLTISTTVTPQFNCVTNSARVNWNKWYRTQTNILLFTIKKDILLYTY